MNQDATVDLLVAYWQGADPEDRLRRDTCRLLADRVASRLPVNVARSVASDARLHREEIRRALADLVQNEPEVRALVDNLGCSEKAPGGSQFVTVGGDHNQVIVASRDIHMSTAGPSEKPADDAGGIKPLNILAIFANPKETGKGDPLPPLRLGTEDRVIRECIRLSKEREHLHLDVRHAATIHDVRRALLDAEEDYRIVHFSGHGTGEGLFLENELGQVRLVPQEALVELISTYCPPIECVILNACYSSWQGWIGSKIPCTIAMSRGIPDEAAIEFTRGFYDAIGAGRGFEFAYEEGCRAIGLMGLSGGDIPALFQGAG